MISLSSVLPWQLFLITELSLPRYPISYPMLSLNTKTSTSLISSLSRSPWLIFMLPPQELWVSQVHFIREKANGCLGKNIFQVNAYWGNRQAAWRNQIYLSHCLLIPKSNSLHRLYHPPIPLSFHSWPVPPYILFPLNFSMLRSSKSPQSNSWGKVLMQLCST